jgi:hypothetical protein
LIRKWVSGRRGAKGWSTAWLGWVKMASPSILRAHRIICFQMMDGQGTRPPLWCDGQESKLWEGLRAVGLCVEQGGLACTAEWLWNGGRAKEKWPCSVEG